MSSEKPAEPMDSGQPFPPLPYTMGRQIHWKVVHVDWLTAEQRAELPASAEAVKHGERILQGKVNREQIERYRTHARQGRADIEALERARRRQVASESRDWDEAKPRLVVRPYLDPATGSPRNHSRREDAIAERDRLNLERPEDEGRFVVVRETVITELDDPNVTPRPAG